MYEEIGDIYLTEHSITGLEAYTVYEFRVVAVNNIGRGWSSNAIDVTTGEKGKERRMSMGGEGYGELEREGVDISH